MSTVFETIYAENQWGHGSGEGSLPKYTRGYAEYLETFLDEKGIQSVVDMGCGDWQFSKDIAWGQASYHGFDVVPSVVEANQQAHARDGVDFTLYSGDPSELPAADLLIVKDVLQHLCDAKVHAFLPHLDRYKYALLTNCLAPRGETVNANIEDGDCRFLDLRKPPFHVEATEVYTFAKQPSALKRLLRGPKWRKHVLLVDNT